MNGRRLRTRSLARQGVFGTAREPVLRGLRVQKLSALSLPRRAESPCDAIARTHGGLREKHPVFHAPENTLSIESPLTRRAVHE